MKKTILSVIAAVLVVIAGLFLYAALKVPKDFRVARSIEINAPATAIFPYMNNQRQMNSWNPWMKLDPNVKVTFSGPEEGVGAVTEWEGNSSVGAGKSTVTHSFAPIQVRLKMEWLKPMEGTSTVDYSLKQLGETTTLEWIIFGENGIFSRVMCIFMDMDKMIGGEFEKGLSELKKAVETK
jgi:hypothetical protein